MLKPAVMLLWATLLLACCSVSHAFVPQLSRHKTAAAFVTTSNKPLLTRTSRIVPHKPQLSRHVLFMGWGPEPIWTTATVESNTAACPSELCVTVTVNAKPDVASEYKIPGQYVQLRLNDETKPLFLAISSPPPGPEESTEFEFLIKKTDDNDWITSAKPGTAVQISQILGNGFPMEENFEGLKYDFPTQNVLLFAAGSGIAPIKAAMESGQLKVDPSGARTARFYYGVRTPDDLCFVDKFKEWEVDGYQVVPVLSDPPASWQGRTGYVQNALEEDGIPIPRNSGALMCGMKEMAESVKDLLMKAGVFEGRVLTNF